MTEETVNVSSSILVETGNASGYLQRLCKHFGHKLEVEFTPERGSIAFEFGRAALQAGPDGLKMTALAGNEEDLTRLRSVLASHLERFAFREELKIDWK